MIRLRRMKNSLIRLDKHVNRSQSKYKAFQLLTLKGFLRLNSFAIKKQVYLQQILEI